MGEGVLHDRVTGCLVVRWRHARCWWGGGKIASGRTGLPYLYSFSFVAVPVSSDVTGTVCAPLLLVVSFFRLVSPGPRPRRHGGQHLAAGVLSPGRLPIIIAALSLLGRQ